MSSYIPADLRRLVESRAGEVCEYCLIHQADTYLGCQVDHIISEKHGGLTDESNLALACTFCNRAKGSDIGSMSQTKGLFVAFFNPRKDKWSDHFRIQSHIIESLSATGEVTARILSFNTAERLLEREELVRCGRYPSEAAKRMSGLSTS
jgi:hypothetical protein